MRVPRARHALRRSPNFRLHSPIAENADDKVGICVFSGSYILIRKIPENFNCARYYDMEN